MRGRASTHAFAASSKAFAAFFEALRSIFEGLRSIFEGLRSIFEGLRSIFEGLRSIFEGLRSIFEGLRSIFEGLRSIFEGLRRHLRRPSQHLRRASQHLRRPSQHFRRASQHLRRPSQHLRRASQHLRRPSQHSSKGFAASSKAFAASSKGFEASSKPFEALTMDFAASRPEMQASCPEMQASCPVVEAHRKRPAVQDDVRPARMPRRGQAHLEEEDLHLLAWSADGGKTWSAGVTTAYTRLEVPALAAGTYLFRVFATVGKVPGEPTQAVSLTLDGSSVLDPSGNGPRPVVPWAPRMLPLAAFESRFEALRKAGTGGAGTVFRARDRVAGGDVAIKILRGHDAHDVERFAREATILAELEHPGIVRYVAHGVRASGEHYLAMEWLEGEDLERRLARRGLSVAEGLTLVRRAAEALAFAHARGLIHRDLKPQNLVLVGGDVEWVKLVDFGIARLGGEAAAADAHRGAARHARVHRAGADPGTGRARRAGGRVLARVRPLRVPRGPARLRGHERDGGAGEDPAPAGAARARLQTRPAGGARRSRRPHDGARPRRAPPGRRGRDRRPRPPRPGRGRIRAPPARSRAPRRGAGAELARARRAAPRERGARGRSRGRGPLRAAGSGRRARGGGRDRRAGRGARRCRAGGDPLGGAGGGRSSRACRPLRARPLGALPFCARVCRDGPGPRVGAHRRRRGDRARRAGAVHAGTAVASLGRTARRGDRGHAGPGLPRGARGRRRAAPGRSGGPGPGPPLRGARAGARDDSRACSRAVSPRARPAP